MGCGVGVKWAIIMFLLVSTQLMGSRFKLGTPLIIVTTRGMTKIINKHYTKCELLVPHTWFYSLFEPHPSCVFLCNSFWWPLGPRTAAPVCQRKWYTHVIHTKHVIQTELQNSQSQTYTKICHMYWSPALSLKWQRKQIFYYHRHRYTYLHNNIIFSTDAQQSKKNRMILLTYWPQSDFLLCKTKHCMLCNYHSCKTNSCQMTH